LEAPERPFRDRDTDIRTDKAMPANGSRITGELAQTGQELPVLIRVIEQVGGDHDMVGGELPKSVSGGRGPSDPQVEGLSFPAAGSLQVSDETVPGDSLSRGPAWVTRARRTG
jgi:hypothetical protein